MASRPAVASGMLPRTGASTILAPCGSLAATERTASGPTVDMSMSSWAWGQRGGQAVEAEHHLLQRLGVGDHGDRGLHARGGLRRCGRHRRSLVGQWLGLLGGPVPDGDIVAGLEQPGRHGRAHQPKANKRQLCH